LGNEKIAKDLHQLGDDVTFADDLFMESFGELFNEAIGSAERATHNMVQAALNVIATMGEDKKEDEND
jgi:hypothetical protein